MTRIYRDAGNQMLGFANLRILGLVFLVILVLITTLNKWLLLTSCKDESNCFRNLTAYLPVFKKGWRIVCRNIWIFWILLVFSVLSVLQGNFLQYLYNKSVAPGVPFFTPFSHTAISTFNYLLHSSLRDSFFGLLNAPVHIPTWFGFGDITSIIFLLAIIFSVKPIKRFLSQSFTSELQSSVKFLKRNLPFFIIATVIVVSYNVLLLIFPSAFFKSRILGIAFFPFKIYWGVFIGSLLTGLILAFFKKSISGEEERRSLVFISSLKFFKPLFFFILILAGFSYCLLIPFQSLSLVFPRWSVYLSSLVLWFYLVFLFVSYLIVQEDIDWKTAFRRNFSMWKENYPQILSLLFIIVLLIWFIGFLFSFSHILGRNYFSILLEIVYEGVMSLFAFWMAAVIMVFCLQLKSGKNFKDTTSKM